MKKFIPFFLSILLHFSSVYAQSNDLIRLIENKYEFYYTIDDVIFYQIEDDGTYDSKRIKKQLFYNQKACDSTAFRLDEISFVSGKTIYGLKSYRKKPDYKKGELKEVKVCDLYKIDPLGKMSLLYSYQDIYIAFTDDFKSYIPTKNKKVITIDWKTGKIDTLIHKQIEDVELGIPSHLINPSPIVLGKIDSKLIILFGISDPATGEGLAERYCIYDLANHTYEFIKKYHEAEYKTKPIYEDYIYSKQHYEDFYIAIINSDLTGKYLYGGFVYAGSPARDKDYLFNDNLDTITSTVKKYTYLIGKNYVKNEVVSLNFTTITDSKREVIIPYKLTLPLERSFYRIYTNQLILEEDQKEFGEYEWSILKNFIYAKHNYQFNSEFYQAYFNVFEFYRAGIDKRKKSVDSKFTKADKENLKLILTKIK